MALSTSLNHNLEIGRRALSAQQAGLNITGHNIANANTPGFSRQRADLVSAQGASGLPGSGADAAVVIRERSQLLDGQMRTAQQHLGRWQALERAFGSVEDIFNEPAGAGASEAGAVFNQPLGTGLSGSLNRFWNTWQDLANAPESAATRAAVRQEGDYLVSTLRQLDGALGEARSVLDREVESQLAEVNQRLDQLAQINRELPRVQFDAGVTADLEDRRDLLLDELAAMADIALVDRGSPGQVSVLLGGHTVVEGDRSVHLEARRVAQDELQVAQVVFADDRTPATIGGGSLQGLLEARDGQLVDWMEQLDELAAGLVRNVNDAHRRGYGLDGGTQVDFFAAEGDTAATISLDQAVEADLDVIAASVDGNRGDGSGALGISQLRDERLMAGGGATSEEFYLGLVGQVGARSQEAQTMSANQQALVGQLENRRQSVQGVSLNEEAAQLVLFQRAYQAAARTISVVDQLLETTLNL